MKQAETIEMCRRAKTRADGVYSYNGYLYLVRNNALFAVADYGGDIYQFFGSFLVQLGSCERYNRKKQLLKL